MTLIGKPKPLTTEDTKEHEGGRIAVIADIARDRHDRKGKSLPLISADHADRKTRNLNHKPKPLTTKDTKEHGGDRARKK
jgi:hypothetical protein